MKKSNENKLCEFSNKKLRTSLESKKSYGSKKVKQLGGAK